MTIIDAVLILFLLCGAVLGFKKGAIRSLVALLGTAILVVVSYYLKNPVAATLFNVVPFINFGGSWTGLVTLNILVYEALAYLLVFIVLYSVLNIILKITGIIEKILSFTIILGIPSKIIGAVLGFLEAVVFSFLILFVLQDVSLTHDLIVESSLANSILTKTPIIGSVVKNSNQAIEEIEALTKKYENTTDKDAYNADILEIMLKYELVTKEQAQKLVDNKKLDFKGVEDVINNFEGNENND